MIRNVFMSCMRTFAQKNFAIFKHQSCGCRIQSVYKHLDVNLCNLRQDLHHELLPVNFDSAEIMVRIMWTKYNLNSTRLGYCVPLVDRWTCRVQCI